MADIEAIKAKIRALQARTPERGCTEAEAMAAAEVALRLMREHGLSDDQVAISERSVDLKRKSRSDVDAVWIGVANTARCAPYYSIGRTRSVVYVGRDPWPDVAVYLHQVIAGAVRTELRAFHRSEEYRKRRTSRTKALAQRHFLVGLAFGLSVALSKLTSSSEEADAARDIGMARKALDSRSDLRSTKYRPPADAQRYADTQLAGIDAGRNTNVAWGVNGAHPVRAISGPGGARG